MGKRRRFRKDKEGGSEIWEEDECRSTTIKKAEYSRGKRL